jgi:hypothetical protein
MNKFAALALLIVPLIFAGCADGGRYRGGYGRSQAGPPPIGYGDQGYRDAREMGHRDGVQAAYRDMQDRRSPDARRHNEYRHPRVDGRLRDDYRNGFADGYADAYRRGNSAPPRGRDDYDRR